MKNLKDKLVTEKELNTWALTEENEKVIFACLDFVAGKAKDKELIKILKGFGIDDYDIEFEELYRDFADQLNKYEPKLSGKISNAIQKIC